MSFLPKFWWGDAFTSVPFSGNPAAVVLLQNQHLTPREMQFLANEFKCSQTAFVNLNNGLFSIKWFSPKNGGETPICGHATLVAAHALFSAGIAPKNHISFSFKAGFIDVFKEAKNLRMVFKAKTLISEPTYFFLPDDIRCYKDDLIHVAEFTSEQKVFEFIPDLEAIKSLSGRALCITAPGASKGIDFVSRYFAPKVGIDEDPVCGSSYCRLAPFWAKKLNKNKLKAKALSARKGEIIFEVKNDEVHYLTNAVIIGEGVLNDIFSLLTPQTRVA